MAAPLLDQVDLVCRDIEASIAFYRKLGVKIPASAIWRTKSGIHHVNLHFSNGVSLGFGSQKLARWYNAGYRRNTAGGNLTVGFAVTTRRAVDALHARMARAGYGSLQEPFDASWGARYAIIADPDGNHVGIMSPSDPKKRTPPPADF